MSRAGRLVIGSVVQIPAPPSCMSKCPWARYWTPNCSWWAVGALHGRVYVISVWMCVRMGKCGMYWTALWAVVRLEKCYKTADHLTFDLKIKHWETCSLGLWYVFMGYWEPRTCITQTELINFRLFPIICGWLFTYILYDILASDLLSIKFVNCDFVVLVCTCSMSVCPGRGIPPL